MYPPMTSESSAGDFSFESYVGLSRKRYRSHAATMTSSIHATRALVHSLADLLPHRKRYWYGGRCWVDVEDEVEVEVQSSDREHLEQVEEGLQDIYDHVIKIPLQRYWYGGRCWVDVEDEVEVEVQSSDRGTMEVGVDMVVGIDIRDGMLIIRCCRAFGAGINEVRHQRPHFVSYVELFPRIYQYVDWHRRP
nr:hypothetical protein [Tanacetum cinerariifolium]